MSTAAQSVPEHEDEDICVICTDSLCSCVQERDSVGEKVLESGEHPVSCGDLEDMVDEDKTSYRSDVSQMEDAGLSDSGSEVMMASSDESTVLDDIQAVTLGAAQTDDQSQVDREAECTAVESPMCHDDDAGGGESTAPVSVQEVTASHETLDCRQMDSGAGSCGETATSGSETATSGSEEYTVTFNLQEVTSSRETLDHSQMDSGAGSYSETATSSSETATSSSETTIAGSEEYTFTFNLQKVTSSHEILEHSQMDSGAESIVVSPMCSDNVNPGSVESTRAVSPQAVTAVAPETRDHCQVDSEAEFMTVESPICHDDVDSDDENVIISGECADEISDTSKFQTGRSTQADTAVAPEIHDLSKVDSETEFTAVESPMCHDYIDSDDESVIISGECANEIIDTSKFQTGKSTQAVTAFAPEIHDLSKVDSEREFTAVESPMCHDYLDSDDEIIISNKCDDELSDTSKFQTGKSTHVPKKSGKWSISNVRFAMTGLMETQDRLRVGDKPYKCDVCPLAFIEACELNTHKQKHTTKGCYKCDVCGSGFTQPEHLERHYRLHTGDMPFQCDICELKFADICDLRGHRVTHTGKKHFKCNICSIEFFRNDNLERHAKIHAEEKSFVCSICQVTFVEIYDFKKHIKIHVKEISGLSHASIKQSSYVTKMSKTSCIKRKSYSCDLCSAVFTKYTSLITHLQRHTGGKLHTSGLCQEAFVDIGVLNDHRKTHVLKKSNVCDICGSAFTRAFDLKKHLNKHTGAKLLKCDMCEMKFVYGYELKLHLYKHTGEKPFKCDVCGKEFVRSFLFKRHKLTHLKEKPYKCDICDVGFVSSCDLKRHVNVHTGKTPYKCFVCGMGFSRSSHLKRHEGTHMKEKPYKCVVCKMSFIESYELKRHQRRHTGEKPYKCDMCQAEFTRVGILNKHKRKHSKWTFQPLDD